MADSLDCWEMWLTLVLIWSSFELFWLENRASSLNLSQSIVKQKQKPFQIVVDT